MAITVAGLFDSWRGAQADEHAIEAARIVDREGSITGSRAAHEAHLIGEQAHTGEAAVDGAGTGAVTGSMIGTGFGLLARLGALAIPRTHAPPRAL